MRRQGGVKLYGPYQHRGKWRLVRRERGKADSVESYDSEEKALAVLKEFRSLVEGKTVMQAIDAWTADLKRRERSSALITFTEGCLYRITGVKETGDALLSSVTPRRAKAMYDALVDSGKYSSATHIASLKRAKAWFAWCIKKGWARNNPFDGIEKIGTPNKGKKQLRVAPARAFLDLCLARGDLAAAAAMCCIILGLRPGEVVAIKGEDVDDGGRLLWIPKGKTQNAKRQVEVPDVLAGLLHELAQSAGRGGRIIPRKRPWVNVQVRKLCEKAGVDAVTAHGLRGTHSTLAVRGGTSSHMAMAALEEVARSIGHGGNTTITTEHYVRPEAAAAAKSTAVLRVISGGRG